MPWLVLSEKMEFAFLPTPGQVPRSCQEICSCVGWGGEAQALQITLTSQHNSSFWANIVPPLLVMVSSEPSGTGRVWDLSLLGAVSCASLWASFPSWEAASR